MRMVRIEHNIVLNETTYVFETSEMTINSVTLEVIKSTFFEGTEPFKKQMMAIEKYLRAMGYLK